MQANCTVSLDIQTLEAIRREVRRRADDYRAAWRMHPHPTVQPFDHRIEIARELDSLGVWLLEKLDEAERALDAHLDERISLTPAGYAAANVIPFPVMRGGAA